MANPLKSSERPSTIVQARKPAVAFRNQEAAHANIVAKLNILVRVANVNPIQTQHWSAAHEILKADGLWPRSIRQFNAWTSEALPADVRSGLEAFHKNANDTLRSSGKLHSVKDAIEALRQLASSRTQASREDTVASLKRRLAVSKALRKIAERELLRALVTIRSLQQNLQVAETKHSSLLREVSSTLASKEAELTQLREQNASLTARFFELRPIGRAK